MNTNVVALLSLVAGSVLTWIGQSLRAKRGVFTYQVFHTKIGSSLNDPLFGAIVVQYNGVKVDNLFFSRVTVKNDSLNDYDNFVICIHTNNTKLMTERAQIVGTPYTPEHTKRYENLIAVGENCELNDVQRQILTGQREYFIKVLNRGQSISFEYMNSPNADVSPFIWASIEGRGINLRFRGPRPEIFGVPSFWASLIGLLITVAIFVVLASTCSDVWIVGGGSMFVGLIAQLPGAMAIRGFQRLRRAVGD